MSLEGELCQSNIQVHIRWRFQDRGLPDLRLSIVDWLSIHKPKPHPLKVLIEKHESIRKLTLTVRKSTIISYIIKFRKYQHVTHVIENEKYLTKQIIRHEIMMTGRKF